MTSFSTVSRTFARAALLIAACCLVALPAHARRSKVPVFCQVAGEIRTVEVQPGDTIISISAANGASVENIIRDNEISDVRKIRPGQKLKVDTRRVIPSLLDNGLVADIATATVYRFEAARLVDRHPAGFGSPGRPTPTGTFSVLFADHNAGHPYPDGVMDEKNRETQVVKLRTPPEPPFTLGPYWIQLSTWGIGIHPTPFLSTIGQYMATSHIRLAETEMARLAQNAKPGMKVEVTYQPVRLGLTPDGEIWLEVHVDVYALGLPDADAVLAALGERAIEADRELVVQALTERRGVAVPVGHAIEPGEVRAEDKAQTSPASWSCLDCPPGPERRVTFQVEAAYPILLKSAFPIEILDDSNRVVYSSSNNGKNPIRLNKGESRNFVWELTDSTGQPLPPGSYTARVIFCPVDGEDTTLGLPLWVGE